MQEENLQTYKNLSIALDRAGLSRAELARRAEVTEASISRYLAGKTEPRSAELLRMARVLGVTMEWLLTGKDVGGSDLVLREPPSPYGSVKKIDRVQRRINEVIRELEDLRNEISEQRN